MKSLTEMQAMYPGPYYNYLAISEDSHIAKIGELYTWLHSPFLQKSSYRVSISLESVRVVIYYRDMKNTRCDECGKRGEHAVWCSFNTEPKPADLDEKVWLAVTDMGRKLRFTLAPTANRDFALSYAMKNSSSFGLLCPMDRKPETIVNVEEEA